jgi:hypothetical protein
MIKRTNTVPPTPKPNELSFNPSLAAAVDPEPKLIPKNIKIDATHLAILVMSHSSDSFLNGFPPSLPKNEIAGTTIKWPINKYKRPIFEVSIPRKKIKPIIKSGSVEKASPKELCKASI